MIQYHFWKYMLWTHFHPFLVQNGPFSRQFGKFHGPKRVPTGSKFEKDLFEHPKWSRVTYGKMRF